METKITACEKCNCTKFWQGDAITCPFQNSDNFADNWNCGLISKIRQICELAMDGKDHRLHYQFCEDQKYVTINTANIPAMGLCLFVSWYKNRGKTEAMWILDEENVPRVPTFNELNTIANHYNIK